MKKFFVLLLLLPLFATAQHTYIPIPEDSAIWLNTIENWHEGEPNPVHTFKYGITQAVGRDTSILGRRYFVLGGNEIPLIDVSQVPAYYGAWYRQDTITKKVYYIRTKGPPFSEEVSYDFSLQVGDTVRDTNQSYFSPKLLAPFKVWVDAIDSVFFPDGTWRYRWHFKSDFANGQAKATQIEGVGFTTGFDEDPFSLYYFIVGYTSSLTCFGLNNQWVYHQPNTIFSQSCDSLISRNYNHLGINNRTADLDKPMFYPNPLPAGKTLTLNSFAGNPSQMFNMYAYDMLGRCVLQKSLMPTGSIALPDLPAGTYFFRLTDKSGKLFHQEKVVLQ